VATDRQDTVADAYLALLASRGIEHLFGNAGTDFPPLIEAYARAHAEERRVPTPLLVPHENVAVAMAHGHYLVSGRAQAVMVHVGLGTANALNGLMNAARQRVPILFTAGRTPVLEGGLLGARNNYINWAQEMFDQAAMVRELVKWDYELRHPLQLESVVDRALALATSEPRGPVYLMLPREVLAAPFTGPSPRARATQAPASAPAPDSGALDEVAALLASAARPVLVTSSAGRTEAEVAALARLAEAWAIPVVQYRPRHLALPAEHPMHCGWEAAPLVREADLVLVVESDVPWIPDEAPLTPGCRVAHLAVDPLFARYPIRGFRADLAVTGATAAALEMLLAAVDRRGPRSTASLQARRARVAAFRAELSARAVAGRERAAAAAEITPAWVSACLDAVKSDEDVVLNEYPLVLEHVAFRRPASYFSHSPAGGLGWAMGAALGVKLAEPDRTVIAAIGDGAYIFGNPTAAHLVSQAAGLPILIVIVNNGMWAAVHRATLAMYPEGFAAKVKAPAFSSLRPSPAFEKIVEASGGWGARVDEPAALPTALARALDVVRTEQRQAVLNVICRPVFERTS